jgi:molybdopterin molybdotransferase
MAAQNRVVVGSLSSQTEPSDNPAFTNDNPCMGELDVSDLIGVQEAKRIIDAVEVRPRTVRLPAAQTAGLILAEDLRADRDSPPFDKAQMDGYAVRAADLGKIPCELEIAETIPAGASATRSAQPGQAMPIMTGAPMPVGADVVVPLEQTVIRSGNRVVISAPSQAGRFIAPRGSDAKAGAVLLEPGSRIGPTQLAVAASIGAADILVIAPPSVGVLGTGDELVSPQESPTGSQIRSCNNAMLMALLGQMPTKPVDLGIVKDDPELIEQAIRAGVSHDVLFVAGGMSMGQRDYVPSILRKLGGELKITKLRIKPGKPFVFAVMPGGKIVFGLPGNPVSAFVCAMCLASRLLLRLAGDKPIEAVQSAPVTHALPANGPRAFYQPAVFDGKSITPLEWKGSADIYTLSRASALLIRPENEPPRPAGAMVPFTRI